MMTKKEERMSFPSFAREIYSSFTCIAVQQKGNSRGNEDLELIKQKSTE